MTPHRMKWHSSHGFAVMRCVDCGMSGALVSLTSCPVHREAVPMQLWEGMAWSLAFVLTGVGVWVLCDWAWGMC